MRLNEGLRQLGSYDCPDDSDDGDTCAWSGVFQYSGLEQIYLPSTLERIKFKAFSGCINLKSITLPEGLCEIERKCFFETDITELRLPRSLHTVGENAFASNLLTVYLPDGSTKITTDLLRSSGVRRVVVPKSVEEIEDSAFKAYDRVHKLREIVFENGSKL